MKELWGQSGGHYSKGDQWKYPEYTIDNPEKFAELIVRECANVAHTCIDDEWFDVGGAILEHFGVEK